MANKTWAQMWQGTTAEDRERARDHKSMDRATHDAWKVLDSGEKFAIYKFPAGHWGWASKNSPIAAQLEATGEIYQTVSAVKWFWVTNGQK